jgi:hypothetical protein
MVIKFDFKDENLNNLWLSYQDKKEIGLKKEANKILDRFIDEIKPKNDKLRNHFVKALLEKTYNEDVRFELQYPLLKQIIFPILVDDLKNKKMPGVRWLYQIPDIDLESSLEIERIVDDVETSEKLLLLALDINENDKIAWKLLLKYYINYLGFSIHEIPAGLLCEVEEGLDVISKADAVIGRCNLDIDTEEKVKELLSLCKILIKQWRNFRNQDTISNFDYWSNEYNFDYLECRAKIWSLRQCID